MSELVTRSGQASKDVGGTRLPHVLQKRSEAHLHTLQQQRKCCGAKPSKMASFAHTWKKGKSEEAEETVWVWVVNFIFCKGKCGWKVFCNAILNVFQRV